MLLTYEDKEFASSSTYEIKTDDVNFLLKDLLLVVNVNYSDYLMMLLQRVITCWTHAVVKLTKPFKKIISLSTKPIQYLRAIEPNAHLPDSSNTMRCKPRYDQKRISMNHHKMFGISVFRQNTRIFNKSLASYIEYHGWVNCLVPNCWVTSYKHLCTKLGCVYFTCGRAT